MLSRHCRPEAAARMLCRVPMALNILTLGGQVTVRNLVALVATATAGAVTQFCLAHRRGVGAPGRHRRTRA